MKYFAVLLSYSWIAYVCACKCKERTEFEKVCSKDTKFGILVETKDDGHTNTSIHKGLNMRRYRIRLVERFKPVGGAWKNVNKNVIFTNKDSAGCGISLETDTYYVLTGTLFDVKIRNKNTGKIEIKKRMKVSTCDLVKKVSPPPCPNVPGFL